jgi:hypothetical protein
MVLAESENHYQYTNTKGQPTQSWQIAPVTTLGADGQTMQNRVKQEFLADRQIIQRTDDTKTMCKIGLNFEYS